MSKIPEKCDVLIVGGGPAGAMSGALLAKDGIDVVIMEKEVFPREVVGESLIPHVWKYFDMIGVSDEIMKAGFVAKSGGSSLWGGKFKKMSFKEYGYDRPGLHVERAEFDDILLKRAKELGASVFHKTKVSKIIDKEDGLTEVVYKQEGADGLQTIKAKYVIDASGQSALLGKQEKIREYDDGFRFHAFWGYYEGGDYLDGDANIKPFEQRFTDRPLTFVSNVDDWGWVWQIVLKEKTSIGIILPKDRINEFKKRGTSLSERFQSFVKDAPLIGKLMKDTPLIPNTVTSIKDYAYKPSQLTIGNSFLIGDASAFVDPINSVGVVIALYGAFLASWSIKRALKNPSKIEGIQEMFSHQMMIRLDLARLISFPSDMISEDMTEKGRKLINQLDDLEKQLTLTQITLTNRAGNLPDFIDKEIESTHKEIDLEAILASA